MTRNERRLIGAILVLGAVVCVLGAVSTALLAARIGLVGARAPLSTPGTAVRLVALVCAFALLLVRSDPLERVTLACAVVAAASSTLFGFGVRSPALAAARLLFHLLAFALGAVALARLSWRLDRPRRSTGSAVADGARRNTPSLSVVIPAFNEEMYLGETLDHLRAAERLMSARTDSALEIVVVDNSSTDATVTVARGRGATIVTEREHVIAKVRNAGARRATHEVVVFLDADTLVPPELLTRVAVAMSEPDCAGGSVDILHRPNGFILRFYFAAWRVVGLLAGLAQGACQFCRRDVFAELGGYDETIYMGEDVDFFIRLQALARRRHLKTCFISDLQVVPSTRRFDRWPVWRTLLLTNPFLVMALRRRRSPWADWYERAPR